MNLIMYIFYVSSAVLQLLSSPSSAKANTTYIFKSIKELSLQLREQACLFDVQLSVSQSMIFIQDIGRVMHTQGITNFEMKHSGLLGAIWQFICRLPLQNRGVILSGGKFKNLGAGKVRKHDSEYTPLLRRLVLFVTTLANSTSKIHNSRYIYIYIYRYWIGRIDEMFA